MAAQHPPLYEFLTQPAVAEDDQVLEVLAAESQASLLYPRGTERRLALHEAVTQRCSLRVVSAIVAKCPGALAVSDADSNLPLHAALHSQAVDEVALLLLRAAPVAATVPCRRNRLALHVALSRRCSESVTLAVLAANPSACAHKDVTGSLPLHLALTCAGREVLPAVLAANPSAVKARDKFPVLLSAWRGAAEVVDASSRTPLHHAISARFTDAVQLLLPLSSFAMSIADSCGMTPLHHAVVRMPFHNDITLAILAASPAAARTPDTYDMLPFHLATCSCDVEVLRKLLDANPAAVHHVAKPGRTPLHIAAENRRGLDVVELLLEADPDGAALSSMHRGLEPPLTVALRHGMSRDATLRLLRACPDAARREPYPLVTAMVTKTRRLVHEDVLLELVATHPIAAAFRLSRWPQPTVFHAYLDGGPVHRSVVRAVAELVPQAVTLTDKSGRCALGSAATEGYGCTVLCPLLVAARGDWPTEVSPAAKHRLHVAERIAALHVMKRLAVATGDVVHDVAAATGHVAAVCQLLLLRKATRFHATAAVDHQLVTPYGRDVVRFL